MQKKIQYTKIKCRRDNLNIWITRQKQSSPGSIILHPVNQIMLGISSDPDPKRLKKRDIEVVEEDDDY